MPPESESSRVTGGARGRRSSRSAEGPPEGFFTHLKHRLIPGGRIPHSSRRLLVVLAVIALLVPAGVLALRSLVTSVTSDKSEVETARELGDDPADEKISSVTVDANPFKGTPAESFAVGEAGIETPTWTPAEPWDAETANKALVEMKAALVTARLGDSMLTGGKTDDYVKKFADSSQKFVKEQIAGSSALAYVTKLSPGYTLRAPPRVKGEMKVSLGQSGQLVIEASYIWVYPLRAPDAKQVSALAGSQLAVLRTVERYEFYPVKGYAKQNRGLRPGDGSQYAFNVSCAPASQGLLALPSRNERGVGAPAKLVYDPTKPPEKLERNCGR